MSLPASTGGFRGRLEALRATVDALWPLGWLYAVVVALVLVTTEDWYFDRVFNFLVLAPAILLVDAGRVALISMSTVLRIVALTLVYVFLTHLWGPPDDRLFDTGQIPDLIIIFLFLSTAAWLVATDENFLDRLFLLVGWAAAINASISMYLFATGGGAELHGRQISWLWPDPNSAAAVFGVVILGLADRLARGRAGLPMRAAFAAPLVVLLAFVALSGARAVAIGIAIGLVAIIMKSVARRIGFVRAALAAAAAVVVVLGLTADRWLAASLLSSSNGYFLLWEAFLERSLVKPWLGHGILYVEVIRIGDSQLLGNAHNKFIDALFYGGVPGLLLLLALIVAAAMVALRAWRREDPLPAALFMLIFIYPFGFPAIRELFEGMSWIWVHSWLPIGLIAGAELRMRLEAARPGLAASATAPAAATADVRGDQKLK